MAVAPSSSSSLSSSFSSSKYTISQTRIGNPNSETLIPGLPDDVSALILSLIPYSHHDRLKPTSKSWHSFLSSKQPFNLSRWIFSASRNPHPTILCIFPQDPSLTPPYLFDPRHNAWRALPPAPCSTRFYGLSNFLAVSLGPHLYVLGGSLFDAGSFPIDRPRPSPAAFRFDLTAPNSNSATWHPLRPMRSPRGSFACAALSSSNSILVAGGGSRHPHFGAPGTRLTSVERFDASTGQWALVEGLPRYRAGCVGFLVGEEEFWVMGGYGECRKVSGVFPVDEYYRDGVVLDLKSGKWREIGDMWEKGERLRLGTVVVIDRLDGASPGIFMLDGDDIFRYEFASNHWWKESSLPRTPPAGSSCGFVALDGELYVMFASPCSDLTDCRRARQKRVKLFIQVYNPKKRSWRCLVNKPPFQFPLDFKTAVMCTIRL